jgi:uncharacterized protein YcbK (DUF882 family)
MWPVLVAMAKAHSHAIDNPFGRIMISVDDLAAACRVTRKRADAALAALHEGELIDIVSDKTDIVCVSLNGFEKWQTPRKSRAEQAANRKILNSRTFSGLGSRHTTIEEPSSDVSVTIELPQTETLTKTLTKTKEPLSTSGKPKRDLTAEARQVFDHWVRVWEKRSTAKFDGARKTNTLARLRSGYTVAELCEAVSGYRNSAHHMGANDQGKKWDDLELFMRSSRHVDAGIAHGTSSPAAQSATPFTPTTTSEEGKRYDNAIRIA